MKVLIIKTSSMGDILHTLPSLTDAVRAIPDISFDWVIEDNFACIPTWHKSVDKVITVSIRRWCKPWFFVHSRNELKIFYQEIRSRNYDAIIDAQGLIKSSVLSSLARGTIHGMNWRTCREPLASLFYNHCYFIKKKQHAVERTRELFAKSLGYLKPETQGDYSISHYFSSRAILTNTKHYVIFIHVTSRRDKLWPEKHWRNLIKLIQSYINFDIKLIWGNISEYLRAERLAIGFRHVEIFPKLSLEHIAKKLISARVIISVDTGLSHLAAALNLPNVTLFGPTNPNLVRGYGKNQYKIVSYTRKMADITAGEVFAFLQNKKLLN